MNKKGENEENSHKSEENIFINEVKIAQMSFSFSSVFNHEFSFLTRRLWNLRRLKSLHPTKRIFSFSFTIYSTLFSSSFIDNRRNITNIYKNSFHFD